MEEETRARREVLIVGAGGHRLGVFAEEAAGIESGRARRGVPLPHAPAAVLGIVSVCGRMLTLLDPLSLLGEPGTRTLADAASGFILALRGDEQLALAVDSSERLREIGLDEIEPATGAAAALAHGTFQDGEARVILLDVTRLFAAAVKGMEQRRRRRVLYEQH
ncbi:MAG TPA: chemotaxis protein CheW [Pyrinomonadaceae bacterium]|jgi:chemotaxis signal transduction protein